MTFFHLPWLTIIVLFPVLAAFIIPFLPDNNGKVVRWYALGVCLLDFIFIIYTFSSYYSFTSPSLQLVEDFSWIPSLSLHWSLGVLRYWNQHSRVSGKSRFN